MLCRTATHGTIWFSFFAHTDIVAWGLRSVGFGTSAGMLGVVVVFGLVLVKSFEVFLGENFVA